MKLSSIAVTALLAGGLGGMSGGAEVIPRDRVPSLSARRSAYRKGRMFGFDGSPLDRNGHRSAGSKLAKQARKGTLTISRIR